MNTILVAGASGMLGRSVVRRLRTEGYRVRVLIRSKKKWDSLSEQVDEVFVADLGDHASFQRCCDGVDGVISCAGASMNVKNLSDRRTFTEVDLRGNERLLETAKASGVKKFVYVSVAKADVMTDVEYSRAHFLFEQSLIRSGMDHAVVRPTGFFYFMGEIFAMAMKGRGIVFGDGSSRTNPIHEEEVAGACLAALRGTDTLIEAGGPEIFTRKEIVELAFRVAGGRPSITSVPPVLFTAAIMPMRIFNPRIYALLKFGAAVSVTDGIAPVYGKRTLHDYFVGLKGRHQ